MFYALHACAVGEEIQRVHVDEGGFACAKGEVSKCESTSNLQSFFDMKNSRDLLEEDYAKWD